MKAAKRFLAFALVFLMLFGELGSPIAMAASVEPQVEAGEVQAVDTEAEETETKEESNGDVSVQSSAPQSSDETSAPAEVPEGIPVETKEASTEPAEKDTAPAESEEKAEPSEEAEEAEPSAEPAEEEPSAEPATIEAPGTEPVAVAEDEPAPATEEPVEPLQLTAKYGITEVKYGNAPSTSNTNVTIVDQTGSDIYAAANKTYNTLYTLSFTYKDTAGNKVSPDNVRAAKAGTTFTAEGKLTLNKAYTNAEQYPGLPDTITFKQEFSIVPANYEITVQYTWKYDGKEHTFAGTAVRNLGNSAFTYTPAEGTVDPIVTASARGSSGSSSTNHKYEVTIPEIKGTDASTYYLENFDVKVTDKSGIDITENYKISVKIILDVKGYSLKDFTPSVVVNGAREWVYGTVSREDLEARIDAKLEGPMAEVYGKPTLRYQRIGISQPEDNFYDEAHEYLDVGNYIVEAVWTTTNPNFPSQIVYARTGTGADEGRTINITQRYVLFRGQGSSSEGQEACWKFYDGTPLKLPKVEQLTGYHPDGGKDIYFYPMVGDDSFEETFFDFEGNAEITDVGWGTNYFTVHLTTNRGLSDVRMRHNYHITLDMGPMGIFPRTIYLCSYSATKVYDGTPLDNTYNKFTDGSSFYMEGSARQCGVYYYNSFTKSPVWDNNTEYYNGQASHSLSVTGKDIVHDGFGFVPGEGIASVQMTGSQTNVGTGKNTFTYTLNDNTDPNNYMFFTSPGNLIVTQPKASDFNATISQENWYYGDEKAPVYSISSGLKDANGNDLAEMYDEPTIEYGYNCYHYYNDEWTDDPMWSENRLIDATNWEAYQQYSVKAGSYSVRATWSDPSGNLPTVTAETLYDVYPRPVRIKTPGLAKIYDGEPAEAKEAKLVGGEYKGVYYYDTLAYNDFLWVDYNSFHSQTDVTMDENGSPLKDAGYLNSCHWRIMSPAHDEYGDYDDVIVDSTIAGVSATNYRILEDIGTIGVYRRPVMFQSRDLTKAYDGDPLNDFDYNGTSVAELIEAGVISTEYDYNEFNDPHATEANKGQGGLIPADTEKVTITFTGTRTLPGTSQAGNTFDVNWNDVNRNNYYFGTLVGNITITRSENELVVQPNGGAFPYNGTERSVTGFTGLTFEVQGHTYTVEGLTAGAAGTNAGTYPVTVTGTPVVRDADGNDVTDAFTVTILDAELVVNPIPVTVTADDATKAAGAADPGFTATVTGMVNGEDPDDLLDFDFDRDPGEAAGDYDITPFGAARQGNYIVTYVPGTLTITPAPAPVVPGPGPDDAVVEPDPVPQGAGPDLQVNENAEVTIDQDETPLAAAPTIGQCCILHLIIMLCALAVTIYYTHDRKKRQEKEFETRFQMV